MAHGGGGVMYGQHMLWTSAFYWWHFECTEIPWWDPEAHCWAIHPRHHLMLQHDNALPHVARICTQFLEAENIPVLAWPTYLTDISSIAHVWDAMDRVYGSVFQFLPISSNFATALKRSGPTFNRPQSTTWSTYAKEMCCTAWGKWWSHQILTGFRTPRNNIFERSNYINLAHALFLAAEVTRVFLLPPYFLLTLFSS